MSCACHGATFCPDLICVAYDNDVPVFVRRDSPEGRGAEARELAARPDQRMVARLRTIREHVEDARRVMKNTFLHDSNSLRFALEEIDTAIAMEAREGGNAEERSHAKHDSADPKGIAHD